MAAEIRLGCHLASLCTLAVLGALGALVRLDTLVRLGWREGRLRRRE
jgi:hypothetical protein